MNGRTFSKNSRKWGRGSTTGGQQSRRARVMKQMYLGFVSVHVSSWGDPLQLTGRYNPRKVVFFCSPIYPLTVTALGKFLPLFFFWARLRWPQERWCPILPEYAVFCRSYQSMQCFADPTSVCSAMAILPEYAVLCRSFQSMQCFADPTRVCSALPILPEYAVLCRSYQNKQCFADPTRVCSVSVCTPCIHKAVETNR